MSKILVVDDEEIVRTFFQDLLRGLGHEVEEADDGAEGLEKYRQNPSDLVITDIVMPRRNGIWLIEELIKHDPNAKIIAMAGYGDDLLAEATRQGALQTFEKPISMSNLVDVLNRIL